MSGTTTGPTPNTASGAEELAALEAPARLLNGGSDLARVLLRSGLQESSPAGALERAALRLGLEGAAPAPTAAAANWQLPVGLAAAVGAGALLLVAGPWVFAPAPAVGPQPRAAGGAPTAAAVVTPATSAGGVGEAAPVASGDSASGAPSATPTATVAPVVSGTDTVKAARGSLKDEIALIDATRAAVAAGRGGAAVASLDRYALAYPRGAFRAEAAMLRVEALVLMGRRAEARRLADPWLKAHPDGPAARRLRALLQ